jgi:hypothetical protein
MSGRSGRVVGIAIGLVLLVVALIGWWRVASLSNALDRSRSELAVQRENVSHLTDEFERTRDDLLQVEEALVKGRRRARAASADTLAMQGCVGLVADDDETGPQTVVFGFLKVGEGREVFIDEAEWYVGDDANREAREDGVIGPRERIPNDYYIRNGDSSRTLLDVAVDAVSVTTTADRHNIPAPKCKTWRQFAAAFRDPEPWQASLRRSPYWLTIRGGEAVQIVEQYRP